ncbi:DUF7835 family putative zinc beta-ribbon protein [Halegenticoccus tardaugens]
MRDEKLAVNQVRSECAFCRETTVHTVALEQIRTTDGGAVAPENVKFARAPARVSRCDACRVRTVERV